MSSEQRSVRTCSSGLTVYALFGFSLRRGFLLTKVQEKRQMWADTLRTCIIPRFPDRGLYLLLPFKIKELTTVDITYARAHIDTDGTVYNVRHVFTKRLPTVVTRMPRKTY